MNSVRVEGMFMSTHPPAIHIKPRMWPRSLLDFCIVMFLIAPILIFVLFIVPSLIAFLLTGSLEITLLPTGFAHAQATLTILNKGIKIRSWDLEYALQEFGGDAKAAIAEESAPPIRP